MGVFNYGLFIDEFVFSYNFIGNFNFIVELVDIFIMYRIRRL